MTSTRWIGENTDTYEQEKEYGEDSARFMDTVLYTKFYWFSFVDHNFRSELLSKLKDTEGETNKVNIQDSEDMTH